MVKLVKARILSSLEDAIRHWNTVRSALVGRQHHQRRIVLQTPAA